VELLGRRLVVWFDAPAAAWRCQDDVCPHRRGPRGARVPCVRVCSGLHALARHLARAPRGRAPLGFQNPARRLAPLSEGRVYADKGEIECGSRSGAGGWGGSSLGRGCGTLARLAIQALILRLQMVAVWLAPLPIKLSPT
jgi:hypothetical protein